MPSKLRAEHILWGTTEDEDDAQRFHEFPRSGIEQAVCARFEEQARRFASRSALEEDSRAVSYGDLDSDASLVLTDGDAASPTSAEVAPANAPGEKRRSRPWTIFAACAY